MIYVIGAYALGIAFEIPVIGRLFLSDLIAVLFLPAALPFLLRQRFGLLEQLLLLTFLGWMFGALASDILNESAFADWTRGLLKIGLFGANFVFIHFACRRQLSLAIFCVIALALAGVLKFFLGQTFGADPNPLGTGWKFGPGYFFTLMLFAASSWMIQQERRFTGKALPFIAPALHMLLNARSLFGISLLAATAAALVRPGRPLFSFPVLAVVLIAAGVSSLGLYQAAAGQGLLGEDARWKHETQSAISAGIVLGGRPEAFAAMQAIADAPWLGHGSWARDYQYVDALAADIERMGGVVMGDPVEADLIPSHSHILGAWVEHGILGAAFWLVVMIIVVAGIYQFTTYPMAWSGLLLMVAMTMLWDIAFSPFGLDRRVSVAASINLILIGISLSPGRTEEEAA